MSREYRVFTRKVIRYLVVWELRETEALMPPWRRSRVTAPRTDYGYGAGAYMGWRR